MICSVRSKVWVYPGMAGWRFLTVDKKQSAVVKEKHGMHRRGFGSIPVRVTIGTTSWDTSIFPSQEGTYLLPLKSIVRKKEGIDDGDPVTFSFRVR